MLENLLNLGFKRFNAEVYIFLVLNGPKKANEIATALNSYKRKVYRALMELQVTGIVYSPDDLPAHFSAVSFDKLLDALKDLNLREAARIEAQKDRIIDLWDYRLKENNKDT
jgi:sugar-specific transcriptional regulator TrmB